MRRAGAESRPWVPTWPTTLAGLGHYSLAASAATAAAVDVVMAGAWAIARTIDLPEYRQVREQTRKGLGVIAATPTSMRHRFSTAFDVGSSSPATPAEPRSVAV